MPTTSTQLIQAFIVGRLLAERAGLGTVQTTQWGAVLMATGLSSGSILLVSELARLEAIAFAAEAEQQRQFQETIEQSARTSHQTAERAIAQLEQISRRLDQIEAQTAQSCTQATCAELLMLLREVRQAQKPRRRSIFHWLRCLFWRVRKSWRKRSRHHRSGANKHIHSQFRSWGRQLWKRRSGN
ncbi:hypothetical protein ACQ4M3_36380 [Leptolyngbya sp. AN03gr2]|uniref:hypothetical protein n=1 Tax=unclassified Leptolyngbya TaxID=2650499 RepID=UPI003D316CBB